MSDYLGVSPIKPPSWKPGMIPGYFWVGGIAAGAWTTAALDEIAGEADPVVRRHSRYVAAAGLGVGTVLLIVDLGRPERFLNMLRILRARSAMSVGAWGLSVFGGFVGVGTSMQALRDAGVGSEFGLLSIGDRAVTLGGLPAALFIGSYTGALLSATSVPAWAERAPWLSPLFFAAASSSGIGALLLTGEASGWRGAQPSTPRRLARAQATALAIELVLAAIADRRIRDLPSQRRIPADERRLHLLSTGAAAAGISAALLGSRRSSGGGARIAAGLSALAGGLALRFLITRSGRRSAELPQDTWEYAR